MALKIKNGMKTMEDKMMEYIVKNYKNLGEITSSYISNGGVIVINGNAKDGKTYEFYYTPEKHFFRSIYDEWNNNMVYDLYL